MPQPRTDDKPVVCITGNNGLIGAALTRAIQDRYCVVGLDRDGQPQPPPEVECIVFDVTDGTSVDLAMRRVRYAYGPRLASFVHLAAYYDFAGGDAAKYDAVTVQGTRRVLQNLNDHGFECEQFVFSSTMLVQAPTEPGRPIDEDAPLEGKWEYPKSKIETERVIREERGEVPAVMLRIAGVYTDRGTAPTIVQQVKRVYERQLESHFYPADPSRGQSFVHLDDTVDAMVRTIDRRADLPRDAVPILIGEPDTYGYGALQDRLGELFHGVDGWRTLRIPAAVAKAGAFGEGVLDKVLPGDQEPFIKPWMVDLAGDHYELDVRRARDLLGWDPRRRLIDTLPQMVESLKADPGAFYAENDLGDPPP